MSVTIITAIAFGCVGGIIIGIGIGLSLSKWKRWNESERKFVEKYKRVG